MLIFCKTLEEKIANQTKSYKNQVELESALPMKSSKKQIGIEEEEPSKSSKCSRNLVNIKVHFNGTNYNQWQRSIQGMLRLEGLRQHVLEPAKDLENRSKVYQSDREAAMIFLQASIHDDVLTPH
jgi:hypothetical protein